MGNFKNENGMALVTVLLMITLFSILGMVVISLSISNTKQVTKTEQEMQAVDLAEMGVVYYKNSFIPNANKKLALVIEDAIEEINKENNVKKINETAIPVDSENILTYIQKGNFLFQVSFLPQNLVSKTNTVDENSSFIIESHTEEHVNGINPQINVIYKSIGNKTNVNESITGTIELHITKELINAYLGNNSEGIITKPEGLIPSQYNEKLENGYSYTTELFDSSDLDYNINSVTALVNGSLELNASKKQIGNSLLYITENTNFGELNGNLDTSKLYIGGNATFGNINGGIKKNSILFIVGDATFGAVNGGVDKTSLVCVGKNLYGGLTDNRYNIISQVTSPEVYNNKCLRSSSNSKDLTDEIADQVDKMTLKYQ